MVPSWRVGEDGGSRKAPKTNGLYWAMACIGGPTRWTDGPNRSDDSRESSVLANGAGGTASPFVFRSQAPPISPTCKPHLSLPPDRGRSRVPSDRGGCWLAFLSAGYRRGLEGEVGGGGGGIMIIGEPWDSSSPPGRASAKVGRFCELGKRGGPIRR